MKKGIVILFHDNASDVDKDYFTKKMDYAKNLQICLVDNNSKDETYQVLSEIAEDCENVSIVNVKKHKTDISAARAGVRFLSNKYNLSEIAYICYDLLPSNQRGLDEFFKLLIENQHSSLNPKFNYVENGKSKKTLFQSLFSLNGFVQNFKSKSTVAITHDQIEA